MARRRRPYDPADCARIAEALADLRAARGRLRASSASRAASYVQRAIKSAEGALHHCRLRRYR